MSYFSNLEKGDLIEFSVFWQAFKTLESESGFQVTGGADFPGEGSKLYAKLLKVFLHPPPPLERESLVRIP